MGFVELNVPGLAIADHRVPALTLRSGQSLELVMPTIWSEADTRHLLTALRAASDPMGLRVVCARALVDRQPSWWEQLRKFSIAKAVSQVLRQPIETGRDICRRCNVDPDQELGTVPGHVRKLLDFELIRRSAEVIVIDDGGLAPVGLQRFTRHVQMALSGGDFSVLSLQLPKVSLKGKFENLVWADARAAVVRVSPSNPG